MGSLIIGKLIVGVVAAGGIAARKAIKKQQGISEKARQHINQRQAELSQPLDQYEPAQAAPGFAADEFFLNIQNSLTRAAADLGFTQQERNVIKNNKQSLSFHNGGKKGVKFVVSMNPSQPTIAADLQGYQHTKKKANESTCQEKEAQLMAAMEMNGLQLRDMRSIKHGDPKGVSQQQLAEAGLIKEKKPAQANKTKRRGKTLQRRRTVRHGH